MVKSNQNNTYGTPWNNVTCSLFLNYLNNSLFFLKEFNNLMKYKTHGANRFCCNDININNAIHRYYYKFDYYNHGSLICHP